MILPEQTIEAGYFVTGVVVELRAGQSNTLHLEFTGVLNLRDGYRLVVRTPPITEPLKFAVDATLSTADGDRSAQTEIGRAGRQEIAIAAPATSTTVD